MAWYHRLFNLVRPNRHARDLDREIAFHLAERTDDLVARGLSAPDAAREAARRFGNRTRLKERTHDVDVVVWLESLLADVRYATRTLLASPAFTGVAILSLALGIGANTAIFSLTNALILKSLPVRDPEQLLQVTMGPDGGASFTNPLWEQVRDHAPMLSDAFAYGVSEFNLTNGGVERRAPGAWVSGGFFNALGVRSVAGRLLQPSDDYRGCPGGVAVSGGFAEREYGGAAAAVGKTVSLNGHPFAVLGVSDPAFFGIEVGRAADIYVPLCAQTMLYGPTVLDARSRWYLNIVARPAAGLTEAAVRARLPAVTPGIFAATLPSRWSAGEQREYLQNSLDVQPAATGTSDLRVRYGRALYTLMVVVGLVLLIACANIANLLLARAAGRQREIAIRLSLGAGRWRVVRQLLTESALLSFAGAGVGVLFARWASGLLVRFFTLGSHLVWLDLSIDRRVLGFTITVAVLTAVLFGLAPAWRATRADPQATLKSGGRGLAGADTRHWIARSLVVGQVALSLALVAAAGLLLGSFRKLVTLDPGFRRDGVLLVSMRFGNTGVPDSQLTLLESDVLRRLRALPGVTSASAAILTPIGNTSWNDYVAVPGYAPAKGEDSLAYFNQVTDGYFATLGTALLSGRDISPDDITHAHHVAVINQTMARRFFGSVRPLGRSFRTVVGDSTSPAWEVVGVVQDAKYQRLDEHTLATAYFPLGQGDVPWPQATFALRSAGAPAALVPTVRAVAADVHPRISLEITTLSAQVSASLARPRLLATLSGFFGVLALVLAMIGLYGTMSYNVTRRRNEIGIRMALGAGDGRVLRMVVGDAGRLVAAGILAGAVLALAGTRLVESFLFGVTPTDPATFGLAALALAVAALAATMLPAWRASRLDPMDALRED